MSSTRYSQPMQIYQDPATSFDHAPMPSSKNASNSKKTSPLRPIKNAASRRNIVLNPPRVGPSKQSPLKSAQQTYSSPSRASFGNKLNMVPMPPPGGPAYTTDSMEKKQPLMSKFKTGLNAAPQKALFTTFSSASEKENYPQPYNPHLQAPYSDGIGGMGFSLEGLYGQKPPQKRLMDAAPIHESRPLKRTKMEVFQEGVDFTDGMELPSPDSFPALRDDGTKPPHSYAQLIGMAILRAANRRLTLAQIYKWISDTYSFYGATDAGWQNSIRHNLSLNKAFIKQERPKDDKGKGNYWAIQPGMEHQFIKEKTRKSAGPINNSPILSARPTPPPPEVPHSRVFKPLAAAATQELPSKAKPIYTQPEPQNPAIPEISSDATIPASDAFPEAEGGEETQERMPASPLIHSSPPPATMHSSPPIARHAPRRHHTPPPVPPFPSSSRTRSHKRKFASMDDSGYFSSLDSSAVRPHRLLTSEADRPIIKRGRAEEEIARLRGSSYDSPTKNRTCFAPPSSSPLRKPILKKSSQMPPPLTPAVKLRAPVRPPPSVSPNTNLRMHRDKVREMVGSPLRGVTCLDENLPWSPAFNLDDSGYMFQDLTSNADLDIFSGTSASFLSVPGIRSPEKRSAKRPRLDRSRGLGNPLADIPLFNHGFTKNTTSTPSLKLTPSIHLSVFDDPTDQSFESMASPTMESPSKLLNLSSPTKIASPNFNLEAFGLRQEDYFVDDFLADDLDDFSGVDIMQGFQKIGAAAGQTARTTPKIGSSRPNFGRSFNSRF
ncbi:Winged helix DNA-binding protein [Venustampulla echinocandica]|uniref:Winged helix DNA-binding protein n=1 Tax=Venustampulla echinocandica TaxID=2656787 RepID=A0A370TI78_9HELO|nr:Winged helix DNA-binding protein [Venustampulla echinocandica]RDL35063.1 Winged helix DNA-binding protein [Venustampulla echinocandica]